MDAWSALVGRRPISTLSALFGLCLVVFLATIPLPRVDNLLIGNDGVLYYHCVHSLVIDGDLDFTNEWQHFNPEHVPAPTPAGRLPNRMPIGMGIVWIPFFLAGHALAWLLLGQPLDGYSYVHQAAVCLGSMTYGFIGLLLAYRPCAASTRMPPALWLPSA